LRHILDAAQIYEIFGRKGRRGPTT
jgi:hypothetical protein